MSEVTDWLVTASVGQSFLHGFNLVSIAGGSEKVHLFGRNLHLALRLAYVFAQLGFGSGVNLV